MSDPRRGVLLVNLGSPDSPSVPDVRRYLHQFLMDPCVIDTPYLLRKFIVCGMILPTRPKHTAAAYRAIWTEQGSPLIAISRRVRDLLQARVDMPVGLAMRYGNPSIAAGLRALVERPSPPQEIFVVPLYPHYAQSTVRTVVDAVERARRKLRPAPSVTIMPPFYKDPFYVDAMVARMREHLAWDCDHLLFSYHGLPEKHIRKEDAGGAHCLVAPDCCNVPAPVHERCYRAHVMQGTQHVARAAGLDPAHYSVSFQSRLGRDPWLAPYTDHVIPRLAQSGARRLLVVCPSFVSDCLETLEEIGIRAREDFRRAGGEELRLIPCLNDHPAWIGALKAWCTAAG